MELMDSNIKMDNKELTDDDLYELVENKPALVIFYSEWSGSFQIMKSIYKKAESVFKNKVKFHYLSNKCCPEIRAEFGIMFFPACLLFNNNKLVDIVEGIVSKSSLFSKLDALVS